MNLKIDRIRKEALKYGFCDVKFIDKWNGHMVYKPIYDKNNLLFLDGPGYLLAKKDLRWADFAERMDIMHSIDRL